MNKIVLLSALLLASALAQTQQFSVKQELQKLKALAAWKAVGPVQANASLGLERSQVYAVRVLIPEGGNPTVSLLMGSAKQQKHVRFAAVMFSGEVNRAVGVAHGYVTGAIAQHCFGLTQAEQALVRSAMQEALAKFKGSPVLHTFAAGKAKGEVSLKYIKPKVEIVLTLERPDQPGQNGWKAFCGLES